MREKRYDKSMKGTGKTYREPEEKKAKVKEEIREVFAGAGLELKGTERGNNTAAFSIKGKLII